MYLVDFGLACKYRDNHGFHRDSEPDERKVGSVQVVESVLVLITWSVANNARKID